MGQETVIPVQEEQRDSGRFNPRSNMQRQRVIKMIKIKRTEKKYQETREKQQIAYKRIQVWLSTDFSAQNL